MLVRYVSLSLLLVAVACHSEEANQPTIASGAPADTMAQPDTSVHADTSAQTPAAPPPDSSATPVTSASAPGIPFGDFHLPVSEFGNGSYTGSLQALWPLVVYQVLDAASASGARVIISLAGSRIAYTNPDGTFNLAKWESRVARYKDYDLWRYVASGTVIGHYLVDEPYCTTCWGGKGIDPGTLEDMARYSKSLWPTMPTGIRNYPSLMPLQGFPDIDFAWAQWAGALHQPTLKITPEQFRDREVAAAKARGVGLVFGLNYLDGGDGSSGINGTYAQDPNLGDGNTCDSRGHCYRYAMSVSEVQRIGTLLAASPYACALVNWKYNPAFIARPGMREALDSVSSAARSRPRTSCVQ
jgi:hypothetical protein